MKKTFEQYTLEESIIYDSDKEECPFYESIEKEYYTLYNDYFMFNGLSDNVDIDYFDDIDKEFGYI